MSATDDVIARLAEARDKLVSARKLGFDGVAAAGDLERHVEDAIGRTTGGDLFLGVIAEKKAAAKKSVDGITTLITDIDTTIARLYQAGNRKVPASSDRLDPAQRPDTYRAPERATPEYERRIDELTKDPAHGGAVKPKTRREADVALELERRGALPAPVRRAPLDTSNEAAHKDRGDFIDAAGKHWDIKTPTDLFPAGGRFAGKVMPAGLKGRYDGDKFETSVADSIADGEHVIVDVKNLTTESLNDVIRRIARRPDWKGKVIVYHE